MVQPVPTDAEYDRVLPGVNDGKGVHQYAKLSRKTVITLSVQYIICSLINMSGHLFHCSRACSCEIFHHYSVPRRIDDPGSGHDGKSGKSELHATML